MTTATSWKEIIILKTCRCPLYGKAHDSDAPLASRDSDKLITEMRQVGSLSHASLRYSHFSLQEGMAMRYNTWNMGGSAGGKQMEMVDAVPGVPKVGLFLLI